MNKVILMGHLTKDPEIRNTNTSGKAIAKFTLAVNRRFSRPGEEKQTDFIPVVAWNKLAEFTGKYFAKGRQVVVVGRIETSSYDDNEGKKRYSTAVVAEEAYFADSKKPASNTSSAQGENGGFYPIEDDDEGLPLPT